MSTTIIELAQSARSHHTEAERLLDEAKNDRGPRSAYAEALASVLAEQQHTLDFLINGLHAAGVFREALGQKVSLRTEVAVQPGPLNQRDVDLASCQLLLRVIAVTKATRPGEGDSDLADMIDEFVLGLIER